MPLKHAALTSLLLGVALCLSGHASAQSKGKVEKIAVLNLGNGASLSPTEIIYLTDQVRGAALRLDQKKFLVMTRENILEMLPPGVDLASCETDCEVETGRNIGADYLVTGEVIRFGAKLKASLRIYDTRSAALIGQTSGSAARLEALERPVVAAASKLFRTLEKKRKPKGKASTVARSEMFGTPKTSRRPKQRTPRSVTSEVPVATSRVSPPEPNLAAWTLVAIGLGAGLGGVSLALSNKAMGEELKDNPNDTELADRVDSSYTLARGFYIAGGVLIAAGALWLLFDDDDEGVARTGGPIVGPGVVGWEGRW
ncbi:MAG: hypothetical protein ACE366_14720 [Bradymonadia bacterium]